MKVAEYKGYEIEFQEFDGRFQIKDISGVFDKYIDATSKIDRVIKAEVKANFPIDAVSSSMKFGEITSYNKLEGAAWFSPEGARRGKERITDYTGKSRFYKATEANLSLVKRYKELEDDIYKLSKEQRQLEEQLTEPITFEVET